MSKFWEQIISEKEEHVVINGECYYIGTENNIPISCKGFDGRRFNIQMLDTGEIITTTNLWYNGVIPDEYKPCLPDTAKFI